VATSLGMVLSEDPVFVNIGDLTPGSRRCWSSSSSRSPSTRGTPDGTIIPNQATVVGDNVPPDAVG
jgi:hypothetical protein